MPSDATDLSIGDVAHEVLDVEGSAKLDGRFEIELGPSFADPDLRERFARQERTGAVRLYRLRDVTLDASLMLLLRGRGRITDTRYLVLGREWADTLVKPLPATQLDPAQHYVIGCNRAWHNYYHWLIQSLPAIDQSLRHRSHRRLTLVLSPLLPWQEETLALLGWQDIPRLILHVTNTWLLPNAEFCDLLGAHMPDTVPLSAMQTFRRMSEQVPWTRGAAEAIYVARTDSENRVAENEAELIGLLERHGVRSLVPGSLSVTEQIATFRAARLVIGLHGAGMSNIVFCQRGSFVYELLPRHHANATFNRLAQAASLNHWADVFDGVGDAAGRERTWRIDLDVVAARLDALEQRMAAAARLESAMDFLRRTQGAYPDEAAVQQGAKEPEPVSETEPSSRFARFRRSMARLFSLGR